uniref:Uncharacterized protein n=1 Tax=Arundo donax TaxID=35708 RepID=A0A0A9CV37_ARUDO
MATSQHTWSEKTLRYFPPLLRDFLMGRMDKRGQAIQAWQQVSFSYLWGWVFGHLYTTTTTTTKPLVPSKLG